MIPGVGTLIKFVSSAFKIPGKALKTASKGLKSLPLKLQEKAQEKADSGLMGALDSSGHLSTLKSMIGDISQPKRQAMSIWQNINRTFIQPVTKELPSFKYVNTENLVKKPLREMAKESAKEKLQKKQAEKTKRKETRALVRFNDKEHQELKEKWKQERKQRNNNLSFEEINIGDLAQQHDAEYSQLQNYYETLLDKTATDTDKIKAEFKYEQEKLDKKYEQLTMLQESLTGIQKNFGKLAIFNENSFDIIQDQIAASADISDSKQSVYNENLSQDIEDLQQINDSNAEAIVDAIIEGQELQVDTLNQLNGLEETNQQRDVQLEEMLKTVEQEQKERHIQQMYVLNNIGAELIAAEQQRQAQSTEQAYLYAKFNKKQEETKLSIPNMITGAILGILGGFFKALANPQQVVESMADAAGSFVAEVLSALQFVFGNGVYGMVSLITKITQPLYDLIVTTFGEGATKWLPDLPSTLKDTLKLAKWLPNKLSGLGMPDMIILQEPSITELPKFKDNDFLEWAFWRFTKDPTAAIKEVVEKVIEEKVPIKELQHVLKVLTFAPRMSVQAPVWVAQKAFQVNKRIIGDAIEGAKIMSSGIIGEKLADVFYGDNNYTQGEIAPISQTNGTIDVKALTEGLKERPAKPIKNNPLTKEQEEALYSDKDQDPIIQIDNSTTNIYPAINYRQPTQISAGG